MRNAFERGAACLHTDEPRASFFCPGHASRGDGQRRHLATGASCQVVPTVCDNHTSNARRLLELEIRSP